MPSHKIVVCFVYAHDNLCKANFLETTQPNMLDVIQRQSLAHISTHPCIWNIWTLGTRHLCFLKTLAARFVPCQLVQLHVREYVCQTQQASASHLHTHARVGTVGTRVVLVLTHSSLRRDNLDSLAPFRECPHCKLQVTASCISCVHDVGAELTELAALRAYSLYYSLTPTYRRVELRKQSYSKVLFGGQMSFLTRCKNLAKFMASSPCAFHCFIIRSQRYGKSVSVVNLDE